MRHGGIDDWCHHRSLPKLYQISKDFINFAKDAKKVDEGWITTLRTAFADNVDRQDQRVSKERANANYDTLEISMGLPKHPVPGLNAEDS